MGGVGGGGGGGGGGAGAAPPICKHNVMGFKTHLLLNSKLCTARKGGGVWGAEAAFPRLQTQCSHTYGKPEP